MGWGLAFTALLLSDIHGRVSILKKIVRSAEFNVAFVAGDISNYSGGAYREVLEVLSDSISLTIAVPGNVDPPEVARLGLDRVIVLHKQVAYVGGLNVAGVGGGVGFAFWGIPYLTEKHIVEFVGELEEALKQRSPVLHVLLTHTPPHGTGLDKIYSGDYVGSKKIREFVQAFSPKLHVCGHIHEGRGSTILGRTTVVNPGPAMVGYYAIARFSDDIRSVEVKLERV